MGVSGCGKSTIGHLLSKSMGLPYFDGDDYHPQANIDKMSKGLPLDDQDRMAWLSELNQLAKREREEHSCIIGCSALKESYRDILSQQISKHTRWVYLEGSYDQILERCKSRNDHFMPASLLQSQFDILEPPTEAIRININHKPKEIISMITGQLDASNNFGLFGLGVMGKSLSRNLAANGIKLSIFNRHKAGVEENVAKNFKSQHEELSNVLAFDQIDQFVNSIQRPRKIMLMVPSGPVVDHVIEELIPLLSEGDIIIDGGNSHYQKTKDRVDYLKTHGIHFVGTGVSGGEEGALKGPSIMPGGEREIYPSVAPILNVIAAKDNNGQPCCTYIGPSGSGHFVKMIHNGIEYVEMQLLCEAFSLLLKSGRTLDEIADEFSSWKKSVNSFLLEITIDILRKKEADDYLLNKILDKAGNKGTGNWAAVAAAQLGMPATMIASALFARYTSFYKSDRTALETIYSNDRNEKADISPEHIREAYQFARIINHHQGFKLIQQASDTYKWNLNLSEIARIWTNGCIIRSTLMDDLILILRTNSSILAHSDIANTIKELKQSAKDILSEGIQKEIALPCLSEAIQYFYGMTTGRSSANLIQAQRDYFGAHTYQRTDDSSAQFYHTNWK